MIDGVVLHRLDKPIDKGNFIPHQQHHIGWDTSLAGLLFLLLTYSLLAYF